MPGSQQSRIIYRFDQFSLDLGRGTLRGLDGADLALRPKAFSLLSYLLDHPGRLHSREALFEALWPGLIVSDDSLTQCVSDLRRALGDRANHVLRTVPRRGYILSADVEKQSIEPSPIPRPAAQPAAAAIDAETTRRELILIERVSAAHDADAALLEEIWGELFLQLARFEELRVVRVGGGAGSEGYRVRSDARVVHGHLRASVLLEDAETGVVIWTEPIDQPLSDLAAMSERLAIPLAHHIARQAASESRRRARHKAPAALNARELCLLAADHHQRGTETDTATAQALLERAIALDPDYAPAYAWQAYVVQRGLTYGWGALKGEAARDRALALARHGAVLAPDSPLCLSRLAYCLYLCARWDKAVLTARMALTGAWTAGVNECVTCSEVLAQGGHPDEAVEVMRRMLRFDPYSPPTVYSVLGRALLMAGRSEEALPELRICAARLPDYAGCHHSILMAAHENGHADEARRAYQDIQRLQPGWRPLENGGPWFFREAADAERLHAAFDAVRAAALHDQQGTTTGDVLSFRPRERSNRP
ncbi:DNA-binding winged helix-turn-helix (wHTH) protein [Bosea sp. BK604]|nr:DNA-binding winged helix-turn-helix (wHTH) protein [Bosea sp. BK604]